MARIKVVGVGPGAAEYLTGAAREAVAAAQVLVGAPRHLESLADPGQEVFALTRDLERAAAYIRDRAAAGRDVAVLASGDPGLFGILAVLRRRFNPDELLVIPGISAVQLAFARLALPWDDAAVVSAHGRDSREAVAAVLSRDKVAVFTGPSPAALAADLLAAGAEPREVYLLGDLSYPEEAVYRTSLAELAAAGPRSHRQAVLVFLSGEAGR